MPLINRLPTISVAASLFLALGASMSFGQSAPDDDASKKRKLAEAIEACDKGASAPLDFSAKAPPVQYSELFQQYNDKARLKVLQEKCHQAWVGAPTEKRMHLQWLRVTLVFRHSNASVQILAPQLQKLAREGSAEAQYLIYLLHRWSSIRAENTMTHVSRNEAWASINKAAEAGHMEAIQEMTILHRGSVYAKRDLKQVVKWARRLEGAPPQGNEPTAYEEATRARAPLMIASTTLAEDGFSATENRMAFRFVEAKMKSSGNNAGLAAWAVVKVLRAGRGTRKDPARAREILEAGVKTDRNMIPVLAEMLAKGEGGAENGKRALEMVRAPDMQNNPNAASVLAHILLSGKVVGYRPQEAIQALTKSRAAEDYIVLAMLLIDFHQRLERPEQLVSALEAQANRGNGDAAMALAKLKLSDNSQFSDEPGARALLKPLADDGNREAVWLYVSTQYSHLGSSSYKPLRQEDGFSDAELMALIDEGIRREEPEAFLLKAKLLRAGILYPQDDRAASDMLRQAARGDNIEALLLLGDAYDDGLGIRKDKKRRLDAWRRAAELGSLKAKSKIARAFTFDTFDRLMTLEEGVTWRIALYNDGYGRSFDGILGADSAAEMEFMGLFMGRAMEAGTDAVAEAVMNSFREAPAGLDDRNLVSMGKAFPPEIKSAIEARLAREGFYRGSPDGYWGPEVRKALAAWVEAKGYRIARVAEDKATETSALEQTSIQQTAETKDMLDTALIDRIRTEATREANAAKSNRQKRAALEKVNLLAQYGDTTARWALVPNYHQVDAVRKVVSAAEITRYGLDMMITRPPGSEKVDFEFIFNATQIYQDGKANEFGKAVIDTIRDDARLHDPLVLGGVLKQFIFAPGACDAVLASAKRAGVERLGADGCDDASLGALVSFAKAKGPAGIAERNKKAAAEVLKSL